MLKSPKAEFKAIPVSNIADKITARKNKVEYIYIQIRVYACIYLHGKYFIPNY